MANADTPLSRAVKAFGTQLAVATILGITQPSVAGWKEGRIPSQHIPALIRAAKENGKRLRAADLIPSEAQDAAA